MFSSNKMNNITSLLLSVLIGETGVTMPAVIFFFLIITYVYKYICIVLRSLLAMQLLARILDTAFLKQVTDHFSRVHNVSQ